MSDVRSRLLCQSIAIYEQFLCAYWFFIDWPIPIETNYLISSIDIDWSIGFPIIDSIDFGYPETSSWHLSKATASKWPGFWLLFTLHNSTNYCRIRKESAKIGSDRLKYKWDSNARTENVHGFRFFPCFGSDFSILSVILNEDTEFSCVHVLEMDFCLS